MVERGAEAEEGVGDEITTEISIQIQIPCDAQCGNLLTFNVDGQNLSIEVPPSSVAGDIMVVKLAAPSREENITPEDGKEQITVQMATGSKLRINQTISKNTSRSIVNNKHDSDGTYCFVWPASRYVVKFINSAEFRDIFQDDSTAIHSIIELGSGHGLVGLAFADVISSTFTSNNKMDLVLTDVEEAIPQIEANIKLNREIFKQRINLSSMPLKWKNHPLPVHKEPNNNDIDYIVGSDLLYNIESIPLLAGTIRHLISKATKVLLSVRWRKPSEERDFFVLLSDVINWKMIHGACPLDYHVYGDGSFESDKYFSQTMIAIQGKVVTLSSVDERGTEQMTDQEFEQYEELQTQIYLGTVIESSTTITTTNQEMKRPKLE